MTEQVSLYSLQQLLICPKCKGKLEFSSNSIKCTLCGTNFPQVANDWFNLMPNQLLENEATQWEERLLEMEDWYRNLIINPISATDCFERDYTPYAPFLATLSGEILDVGGGIGLPRNYLPPGTKYIVIDPSVEWLRTDWSSLVKCFPLVEKKPNFVRGVGEYLPFSSQSFDAVLSFWSLNHASDPALVFSEVARVLRPGGRFLIVLEEMIPQWFDLFTPRFPASRVFNSFFNLELLQKRFSRLRLFLRLLRSDEWPLQEDHIRIQESEIQNWAAQSFEITLRVWINQYLTFELRKGEMK